jgi:hypothetical protein
LSQFQHTGIDRTEVFKLLKSINALVPETGRRSESQLTRAFEKAWPDLEKELNEAARIQPTAAAPKSRDPESIMKETLELVRGLARDAETAKMNAAALPTYTVGSSGIQIQPGFFGYATVGGPPELRIDTSTLTSALAVHRAVETAQEAEKASKQAVPLTIKPHKS